MRALRDMRAVVRGLAIIQEAERRKTYQYTGIQCDFTQDNVANLIERKMDEKPPEQIKPEPHYEPEAFSLQHIEQQLRSDYIQRHVKTILSHLNQK